jgi:hypothetical protein
MQLVVLYRRTLTGVFTLARVLALCALSSQCTHAEEEFIGIPWTGDLAVKATTQRLAALENQEEGRSHSRHIIARLEGDFQSLASNPGSPDVAIWPIPDSPVAAAPEAPQTADLSFTAATYTDTGSFPPDSMGAVGPAQYVAAVNGRLRSFNKTTGLADGVLNVDMDVFFEPVMTPPATNNFTSDPRIRYDRLSGRWFLIIIDVPGRAGALPNRVLLAVSDSGVLTPATVWSFYYFQHDVVSPAGDSGQFADYPTLGIDANALYIGVNLFGTRGSGSFANTTGFVIRKSSVLNGGPIVVSAFRGLVKKVQGVNTGPYTPHGVDNYDPNATEGYFLGVDAGVYGKLALRRVSNPGGTPSMSANVSITVPLTGGTLTVPHLGNTGGSAGNLDGLDYRLMAAHIRNGRLWTSANIAVDNSGVPSGTDSRVGVRWYELQGIGSGQTPSVVQSGTLFQPSANNTADQRNYWMGTIMVSGQGHALMGFSTAGANEFINAGTAGRLASDPLGTLRTAQLYTSAASSYNPVKDPGGAGGRRWGDYSYTCLDPSDDMTMWTIQEFCASQDIYGVRVAKLLAPPPATLLSCTPSVLNRGTNVSVLVTGLSSNGSGFFDPGPGFSNRLVAALSGTDVTVQTITYSNATNLTLHLAVNAAAAAGPRALTIINPDGQQVSSSNGFLTITGGTPPTNHPPVIATIADQIVIEQELLSFTVAASDPETNSLQFALLPGAPEGCSIHPVTGNFSWMPTEAQGPATNNILVRVTDNGVPALSATQSFRVIVLESNLPPLLAAIPDQVVYEGELLSLQAQASDEDLPANHITYSLLGSPSTALIDSANGVFNWTPGIGDAGSTKNITVKATDDGSPARAAVQTFKVTVVSRPEITSIQSDGSLASLTWTAVPGKTYALEFLTNAAATNWSLVSGPILATSNVVAKTDLVHTNELRIYRVKLVQ